MNETTSGPTTATTTQPPAGGGRCPRGCEPAAANPLLLPSLLRNKGFTSGMLLGLVFFAAVGGLSYVISLFLQTALHFTPRGAALAMAPLMVGIIIASFLGRPLIPRLGRILVAIGLAVTLAGAAGLWTAVLNEGVHTPAWLMAPSLLALGVGMGLCFTSLYDVAIGDIAEAEAGSASGSLSAVQQLATAIGSAVVTTVYFSETASRGAGHAMTVSVAVVAAIAALGLGLVWLLPRKAQASP